MVMQTNSLPGYHPTAVGLGMDTDTGARPESAFTARIRMLGQESEAVAGRLSRVLTNMRPNQPSVADTNDKPRRVACIEDHLQHAEAVNEVIDHLLREIESLIG